MHWVTVRFYEMGDISTCFLLNNIINNNNNNHFQVYSGISTTTTTITYKTRYINFLSLKQHHQQQKQQQPLPSLLYSLKQNQQQQQQSLTRLGISTSIPLNNIINNNKTNHFQVFRYSPYHKTLSRSSLQMHWVTVRFYEMGDISTCFLLNNIINNNNNNNHFKFYSGISTSFLLNNIISNNDYNQQHHNQQQQRQFQAYF